MKQLQEALTVAETRGSREDTGHMSNIDERSHRSSTFVQLASHSESAVNVVRGSSRGPPSNPQQLGYQPVNQNDEEDTDGVAPLKSDIFNGVPSLKVEEEEMDMSEVIDCVIRELRVTLPEALEFRKDALRVPSDFIWAPQEKLDTTELKAYGRLCLIRFGTWTEQIMTRSLQFLALVDLIYVPFILAFAHVYPVHHFEQVWLTDFFVNVIYLVLAVPIRLRTSMVCPITRDEITDPVILRRRLLGYISLWADVVAVIFGPMVYADLFALRVRHKYLEEELDLEVSFVLAVSLQLRWLGVIRIFKVWRLKPDGSRTMLLGTAHLLEEVAEIASAIFLAAHVLGCVWFWGKTQSPEGYGHEWTSFNGWSPDALNITEVDITSMSTPIHTNNLAELPMDYLRSLKDGIYMLVGWGGPDSTSHIELALCCVLGPLSSIVSGLILARLLQINDQHSCLESMYANKMATINAACDGMALGQDLRARINRYHSYMSFHQMDQSSQDMLYAGLSVNLLAEVKLHCMRDVIANTSFFEGLPPRLISFLVVSFEETTYSPGDVIVRKDEIGDMMYIIMRGKVGIFIEEFANEPVAYKYPGNYFGEISLVFPMPRTAWIRSMHYVVLMQLNKEKFDYILEECPQEKNTLLSRIVQDFRHLVPDLDKLSGDEGMKLLMQELTKAEEKVDQGRRGSFRETSRPVGATLTFGGEEGSRENSARKLSGRKEAGVSFAGEVAFEGVESMVVREASSEVAGQSHQSVEGDGVYESDEEEDRENQKVLQAMQQFAVVNSRKSVSLATMRRGQATIRPARGGPFATNRAAVWVPDDDDAPPGQRPVDPSKFDDLVERVKRMEDMLEQVANKLGVETSVTEYGTIGTQGSMIGTQGSTGSRSAVSFATSSADPSRKTSAGKAASRATRNVGAMARK